MRKIILLLTLSLASCSSLKSKVRVSGYDGDLLLRAKLALAAISNEDAETIASIVHPGQGIRISPDMNVTQESIVLKPKDIKEHLNDEKKFKWGIEDGTGDPIVLTLNEYLQTRAEIFSGVTDVLTGDIATIGKRRSSAPNTTATFFASDVLVVSYRIQASHPENHDWQTLWMVFRQKNGVWFLVGLVNDQWTI